MVELANLRQRLLFFREFAGLLQAGVPLGEALATVRRIVTSPDLLTALEQMQAAVMRGVPLHLAMRQHPTCFSDHEVALVQAGAVTGELAPLMLQIGQRIETLSEVRSQFMSAMVYPLLTLTMSCLLIPFPLIVQEGVGAWLVAAGTYLAIEAAVIAAVVVGLPKLMAIPGPRNAMIAVADSVPVLKGVVRARRFGLVYGTLAAALKCGILLPSALRLASRASDEEAVALGGERAIIALKSGAGFADALAKLPGTEQETIGIFAAGEQTGAIADATARQATFFEDRYRAGIGRLGQVVRFGGSLLVAIIVSIATMGQMAKMLGDPMALLPASERSSLQRELNRAMPQLKDQR